MNKEQFEGQWNQLKGKIKEKWGKLTDSEITEINGKYDQFVGKLQKKYGYAKERVEEEIRNWRLEHAQTGQRPMQQSNPHQSTSTQKPMTQTSTQKPMNQPSQKSSSDKQRQQRPMR